MKRLFLFLAAIVATTSCNNDIEGVDGGNDNAAAKTLTFDVQMTSPESRVNIEEDGDNWAVTWNEKDQLSGFSTTQSIDYSLKFKMTEDGYDAENSTFTGNLIFNSETMRLVYPYNYDYEFDSANKSVALSLGYQEVYDDFSNLSQNTYMVSNEFEIESVSSVTASTQTPISMSHVGTAMELKLQFETPDIAENYVLISAMLGYSPFELPVVCDLSIADGSLTTVTTGGINLSASDIAAVDGVYTVRFNAFPFSMKAGDVLPIDLKFADETGCEYIASADITADQAVEFARGTKNTIYAKVANIGGDVSDTKVVSIKELFTEVMGMQPGVVEADVNIEAEVTVNYDGGNFDRSQLFVQDASGLAVQFAVADASLNTLNAGDKVTINMKGLELVNDENGAYVTGLTLESFRANATEDALNIAPIEVATISDITPYMNGALVSLSQVEYAAPYGSYANFDEKYYGNTVLPYTPFILQDANGDTIESRVVIGDEIDGGAIFKYSRYLPTGSGEFVGILQADEEGELYIKMRTLDDDKITEENRIWKNAVAFYWKDRSVLENCMKVAPFDLEPAEGTGSLFLYGPEDFLYNVGYAYIRTDLSIKANSDPTGKNGPLTSYQALNTAGLGWSTIYDGTNAAESSAWEITTNTVGASEVALALLTSSSATGPGNMMVLYSTDGGATYKEAGTYYAIPWNTKDTDDLPKIYYATTLGAQVVLPNDAAGCEELKIRLTASENVASEPAYGGIGKTGTNRITYAAVMVK